MGLSQTLKFLIAVLLIYSLADVGRSSLFDPHLFPTSGPFFEGWYMRVTDFSKGDSVGLLFGSVLPEPHTQATGPLVLASILLRKCDVTTSCKLLSIDGAFKTSDLNVTVMGQPVSKNPDVKSPSDFQWNVNDGSRGGYFIQSGNTTTINFRLGDVSLKMKAKAPSPWNTDGTGPEGWLGKLPLPLHWFVFSLRSELEIYEVQNITSGEVFTGTNGVVHMEKNWGQSFPKNWIWSEGVLPGDRNASFAISGGLVDLTVLSVDAYLIGIRDPSTGLSIDFRPDNSLISTQINGCLRSVNITAHSLYYRVQITLTGRNKTFSSCLYGPETRGFEPACVETYDATASFEISKRGFLPYCYSTLESLTFHNVALEFGGSHVCDNGCAVN